MITIKSKQELVDKTREYLGVPFLHRGRTRKGLDCGGLIIRSLLDLGYTTIEDMKVYGRQPKDDSLRQFLIRNLGNPIPLNSMQPGDVALIKFNRDPHHVALIGDYKVDKNSFTLIHSFGLVGKVVEHRLNDEWLKKIVEIYRFPVLE